MITLLLVLLTVAVMYAVEHRWPGFRRIGEWWLRHADPMKTWVRRAPLTYMYLGLLTFTTWLLWNTDGRLRTAFLSEQSTSLHQLSNQPLTVLVRSAMYVTPPELLLWWILFSVVVAPLEHRVGWRRVLVGFAVGHMGATLAVAPVQLWAAQQMQGPAVAFERIDVGASYGFFALAALATFHGTRRRRLLWLSGVLAVVVAGLALDLDWTAVGHAVAAGLGFACFPLVSSQAVVRHQARVRARRLWEQEH
ncbi:rhomboid-like protein [Kocuria sp.]|uniref:rhomboid-like protein n=1 Tax=Kocuria sp. TaxID=1871328 RepID=UPI0026DB82B5|nr:rhomboid-like protein [Kocuria sp.]MDO4919835.1 hypothetical protein [Kocuria sp.]